MMLRAAARPAVILGLDPRISRQPRVAGRGGWAGALPRAAPPVTRRSPVTSRTAGGTLPPKEEPARCQAIPTSSPRSTWAM